MALKILWTKRATLKFNKILLYLENEWSEKVKIEFIRRTFHILDLLSSFPKLGSIAFPVKKIRCILITKQVKLFYRIKKDRIILLTFFDTRQEPQKVKL